MEDVSRALKKGTPAEVLIAQERSSVRGDIDKYVV